MPQRRALNTQHIPNRISRFFLCCRGDMGIGIQREAGGEVAQHTRYGFYVNSVLQGNGGEGVAEVVESDLGARRKPGKVFPYIFPLVSLKIWNLAFKVVYIGQNHT